MATTDTTKATYVKPYQRQGRPVHGYLREGTHTLRPTRDLNRHDFTRLLDSLPEGTTFTLTPTTQTDPAWPLRGTWVKQDLGSLVYWWNNQRGLNKGSAAFHTPAAHQVLEQLGLDRGTPKPKKGKLREPHDFLADPQVLVDKGLIASLHGIRPGLLVQRNIKRAMDAISNTHKISALTTPPPPKVPIVSYHVQDEQGTYRYDAAGGILEPTFIRIDPFAQSPHVAVVHEFAHYLDQQILGGQDNFASSEALMTPGQTHLLDGVMGTIRDSQTLKDAMRIRNSSNAIPIKTPSGAVHHLVPAADPAFQKHMLYLLQANELFARAYTQYIALRGGNDNLYNEVDRKIDPEFLYPEHWTWDDFVPIADAFDSLFEGLGWRDKQKRKDAKRTTHVRDYVREGHPVHGYDRHATDEFAFAFEITDKDTPVVQQHLADLNLVPRHVWDVLLDNAVSFRLGNEGVGKMIPELSGHRPRGWKGGYTWDRVAGVYLDRDNKVVAGVGNHGSKSVVLHEMGHAAQRAYTFPNQELRDHHIRLYPRLDPYLRQKPKGGKGNAHGMDELFATGFEWLHKMGRDATVAKFDEDYVSWLEGVLASPVTKGSQSAYSGSDGVNASTASPTQSSPSSLTGTSRVPSGSSVTVMRKSVEGSQHVHVRPYLRDGHLVSGYDQARAAADIGRELAQIRPEIIEQAREKRSKPGQGDRHTRTTTPVKGRHGTRQALLIQATEFFKAEGDWPAMKKHLEGFPTKQERDGELLAMYDRATRQRLTMLTTRQNGNRVAVRVPSKVVPDIVRDGRLRNAHDPAHRLNDRTGREGSTYVQSRADTERKVFSIGDGSSADEHPIYGYVTRDDELLDKSIAEAFGDTKITLSDDIRPRTTVTYSDSLFIRIGDADAVPSPINDPSELSVVHWMNLGGVKVPIMRKGEVPNVPPPLPPRLRALEGRIDKLRANGWTAEADRQAEQLRVLTNEWLDKQAFARWPHGDFIEAQIHGGIRLDDIERIDFPTDPGDAVRRLLDDAGISWTVGGPAPRL